MPDEPYGSGVLSLDAHTGTFAGFFEPSAADCYRPTDNDADVCGSPTIFRRGDKTMVAIGTKAGGFFVIGGGTFAIPARRNVLPYRNDDPAQPPPAVDPHSGVAA